MTDASTPQPPADAPEAPSQRVSTVLVLAVLLAAAAGLVTAGAAALSTPAGLIVGGVLLAAWAVVVFLPTGDES